MSTALRTPEQQIRQRYRWFELAAEVGSVTVACERCGISRKTYYKWQHRLAEARGERQALLDRSRRPHWPRRRVKKAFRRRLLHLRQRTRPEPARLRALLLVRGTKHVPSTATIAKVVKQAGLTRWHRAKPTRYRRVFVVPRPGDLVPLEVTWVSYLVEGRQAYQCAAIDCCTRLRLVSLAEEMMISAAKAFAQFVLSTFPFPVRCVQTDNDAIFTVKYSSLNWTSVWGLGQMVAARTRTAAPVMIVLRVSLIPSDRLSGRSQMQPAKLGCSLGKHARRKIYRPITPPPTRVLPWWPPVAPRR